MVVFETISEFMAFLSSKRKSLLNTTLKEACKTWKHACPDGSPMPEATGTCAGREGWIPFTEEERLQRTLSEPPKGPLSSQEWGPIVGRYPNQEPPRPTPFRKAVRDYSDEVFHPDELTYSSLEGVDTNYGSINKPQEKPYGWMGKVSGATEETIKSKAIGDTPETPSETPEEPKETATTPASAPPPTPPPQEPPTPPQPNKPKQNPPKQTPPPKQAPGFLDAFQNSSVPDDAHIDREQLRTFTDSLEESPNDTTPLLIMADWLEESGAEQVATNIRSWTEASEEAKKNVKWNLGGGGGDWSESLQVGRFAIRAIQNLPTQVRSLCQLEIANLVLDRFPPSKDAKSASLPKGWDWQTIQDEFKRARTEMKLLFLGVRSDGEQIQNELSRILKICNSAHRAAVISGDARDQDLSEGYANLAVDLLATIIAGNSEDPADSPSLVNLTRTAINLAQYPNDYQSEREYWEGVITAQVRSAALSVAEGLRQAGRGKAMPKWFTKAMSALSATSGAPLRGAKLPKKLTGQSGETGAQLDPGHPPSSSFREDGASWTWEPLGIGSANKLLSPYTILRKAAKITAEESPYTGEDRDSLGRRYCYVAGRRIACAKKQGEGKERNPAQQTMGLDQMANAPSPPTGNQRSQFKVDPNKKGTQSLFAIIFNKEGKMLVRDEDPYGGFVWTGSKSGLKADLEKTTGLKLRTIGKTEGADKGKGYYLLQVKETEE